MKIEVLDGFMPERAHESDVGYDLKASSAMTIPVASSALVPCGFKIELKEGHEAQVRSRSGLALKRQVVVLNSPGTIDPGYRGEVGVILANMGSYPFVIERGDRIAQMVIAKFESPKFVKGTVSEADRGEKGFGSTGS